MHQFAKNHEYDVRTIFVNTAKRDVGKYPNPSDFTQDLPFVLNNLAGIAIRNFKVKTGANDLVLRITDVECVHANDAISNRASAILFMDGTGTFTVYRSPEYYTPLLQVQHRLQKLRIQLVNLNDGSFFDTVNDDAASFVIEFYCLRDASSAV